MARKLFHYKFITTSGGINITLHIEFLIKLILFEKFD